MQNFKSSKMARNTIGTISLLLACADASALGQVSRSCRFSEIPFGLQNISARFFRAVGAPASILSLPALSSSEQAKYRIFESITTDYLRFRYLLFAMSWTFDQGGPNGAWRELDERFSVWTAESISSAMEADPYFRPYYLNRSWVYSARAGDPRIAVWWPGDGNALVLGAHFYYDISGKKTVRLADTMAVNCNLPDMGAGTGLWGR